MQLNINVNLKSKICDQKENEDLVYEIEYKCMTKKFKCVIRNRMNRNLQRHFKNYFPCCALQSKFQED